MLGPPIYPDTGVTINRDVWRVLSIVRKTNKETLLFIFIACYSRMFSPVRKATK